jgi:hypothetical protein
MKGRATSNRVCVGSGQRPARVRWTTGMVICPWCEARTYLTMKGKLYKHQEKRGV